MRIKLDENLPVSAVPIFAEAGHDVDTVIDEELAGSDDPTVSRAASAAARLVITLDRGFGDIERYPPGTHSGILVLRLDDQSAPSTRAALSRLIAEVDLEALSGCIATYSDGHMRVRRPSN